MSDQTRGWFERLYGNAPGLISLAHVPSEGRFQSAGAYLTPSAAASRVAQLENAGARGVYHRVTTLAKKPEKGQRGSLADSLALPGLWADVDFGSDGHKHDPAKHDGRPLPPNATAAWRLVAESELPQPSVWIHTGGGLYPWWVLSEPLILSDDNREAVQTASAAWQKVLQASAQAHGWDYGAGVGDLPRVLRVPGTTNRKTDTPRPCRLAEDTRAVYTWEDLVAALAAAQPPTPPPPEPQRPRLAITPGATFPLPRLPSDGTSAFDTLDEHVTFDHLLTTAGWTEHRASHGPSIERCWTRPGDPDNPCSAHTLKANPHALVVFSESAGLPAGGGQRLTRGRVFAQLHHGGDERAAALDLYAAMRGHGSPAAQALPLPRSPMLEQPVTRGDLYRLEEQEPPPLDEPPEEDGPPSDGADDALEEELQHNRDVAEQARRIRVRRDVTTLVRSEEAQHVEMPDFVRLDDFLARPLPSVTHRVDKLWPAGGNVLLTAQWKAGKTTLRDNLMRSLVDDLAFLGMFAVNTDGSDTVALMDFELDGHTLQRWLRDQGFEHPERLHVVAMRGRASSFNILDDKIRARWATNLRDLGVTQLVLDCLRPILDALGLEEHKEAGRFLEALDALGAEADITEKFLVHHMGHGSERSRGDSRLLDWPDALWKLTRLKTEDDPTLDDPAGPRFFSAFGRDVNHPESELTFDEDTRHLTLGLDAGDRKTAANTRKAAAARPAVLQVIRDNPGIGIRQIREKCDGHGNPAIDAANNQLITEGAVQVMKQGQKHCHYATDATTVPTVPNRAQTVPRHGGVNRARVPLGTGTPPSTQTRPLDLPGTGTVNRDRFEKPTGPGRCEICAHHVQTQDHAEACPERNAS